MIHQYKLNGYNIVLDVFSGSVHCVDDLAYDVIEMMYAGASLVMVGAENLVNPYACKDIIDNLPKVMDELGIDDLEKIIGKAK